MLNNIYVINIIYPDNITIEETTFLKIEFMPNGTENFTINNPLINSSLV